jgi:hypothetical protein
MNGHRASFLASRDRQRLPHSPEADAAADGRLIRRSAPLLSPRCCARKSHPNGCYERAMSSSVVTKRRHASQACSGGSAGLEPPDASGAGAILFSQHSGHSTFASPCRPCSCSHAKYAAPATSSKLRPPPKGRPGALSMRRCIAVHLSIDKAARPGAIAGSRSPSSVTPSGRIDCKISSAKVRTHAALPAQCR